MSESDARIQILTSIKAFPALKELKMKNFTRPIILKNTPLGSTFFITIFELFNMFKA